MPKCKLCNENVDKNETSSFIKKSGRYIHISCENKRLEEKEKAKKTKVEQTEEIKKKEKSTIKCSFCKEEVSEEDLVKRGSLKIHKVCLEKYHNSNGEMEVKTTLRTCPKCKEKVDPLSPDAIDTDITTYHRGCYESLQRAKKNFGELTTYISLKYDVKFPTGYMLKQINDFHVKRNYSYKSMLATLKFMFEIEKVPTKEGVGLGLIPFYYEKAKVYYSKIRVAGNSANNVIINNKIVKIVAMAETKPSNKKSYDLSSF